MKGLEVPALVLEGAVFAGIASLFLIAAVVLLALRTRSLPVCWNCGLHHVRRAHSHRILDNFARVVLLYPYRCENCLRRFYGFRSRRVPRHAHGRAAGSGH